MSTNVRRETSSKRRGERRGAFVRESIKSIKNRGEKEGDRWIKGPTRDADTRRENEDEIVGGGEEGMN